jgi:LmbE family N-acetylglucosaminyl deacetylase
VKVHHVGARAAELAGTPRVLQATVPRDLLLRGIRLAAKFYRFPPEFEPSSFERAYSASAAVTHRIDVRRYASQKRASMRAHASQSSADGGADRTLAAFLRIPRPLFALVFGREWFVDAARPAGSGVARDVFA